MKSTNTERDGWRLKLPSAPPCLDDARLLEYRHPIELPMLGLSLVALVILLVGAALLEHKAALLGVAGIWVVMIVTSLQALTYNLLRGAEVTPTQFSEIYQMIQELRQRFQAPPVRAFVIRRFGFEPETMRLRAPYTIVLPSVLLDSLKGDQLRYVLGRALGHIRFGHTRIAILLGGDDSMLPAPLSWLARVRNVVFAGYRRAQLLSADRAGILASGVGAAIETEVIISVGNSKSDKIRADDLIDQAYQLTRGLGRLHTALIMLASATPPLIYRLEAMVEWAALPLREPGTSLDLPRDGKG
jgi:Zn-dependent protease with chaperone function